MALEQRELGDTLPKDPYVCHPLYFYPLVLRLETNQLKGDQCQFSNLARYP